MLKRQRKTKILATLGPASTTREQIEALFLAGADVFRFNFSHGSHDDHQQRYDYVRQIEAQHQRPIGVLADLQGPKLRVARFAGDKVSLKAGQSFRVDLDPALGDTRRVNLPHPEVFAALKPGAELLLDDGRVTLRVKAHGQDYAETEVATDCELSNNKGLNVPNVVLPISSLTRKDRRDLDYALKMGADWIALSFVQRAEDVKEVRLLVDGRARVMSKLEKPAALDHLDEIVALSDGIMVARGDLGVECPPESVPILQKRIVRAARQAGRPVVVATQMLDSMVHAPTPTRAEASDVATAVYDGSDAVMLSAESASGKYPREAVAMMDRIIQRVEGDEYYSQLISASRSMHETTATDAVSAAARNVALTLSAAALVSFTSSGSTALRAARERPEVPILSLTPHQRIARQMSLVWGVHSAIAPDVHSFSEMTEIAIRIAHQQDIAQWGDQIVVTAGVPFGTPGSTNILRIAAVKET